MKEEKNYVVPRFNPSIPNKVFWDLQDAIIPLSKGIWNKETAQALVRAVDALPSDGARRLGIFDDYERLRRNALAAAELIEITKDAIIYAQNGISLINRAMQNELEEYKRLKEQMIKIQKEEERKKKKADYERERRAAKNNNN